MIKIFKLFDYISYFIYISHNNKEKFVQKISSKKKKIIEYIIRDYKLIRLKILLAKQITFSINVYRHHIIKMIYYITTLTI